MSAAGSKLSDETKCGNLEYTLRVNWTANISDLKLMKITLFAFSFKTGYRGA